MNNLACYYAIKDHKMRGYLSYLELKLENLVATRLDFRRLPGPVLILPEERGDECGLIFPNSGW